MAITQFSYRKLSVPQLGDVVGWMHLLQTHLLLIILIIKVVVLENEAWKSGRRWKPHHWDYCLTNRTWSTCQSTLLA